MPDQPPQSSPQPDYTDETIQMLSMLRKEQFVTCLLVVGRELQSSGKITPFIVARISRLIAKALHLNRAA